tara:strand:- start:174 stop:521 length:348 start_codon:yes stop_codon:yes gene_type:complete
MKTIFCDIDGTLCVHHEDIVRQHSEELQLLPGTLHVLKEWEKKGYRLILVTGRKESHRKELERQLKNAGIFWDYLIMGLSNGVRVMINDMKEEGQERSYGINVVRNLGISELENL